jgi:hypothetical protein
MKSFARNSRAVAFVAISLLSAPSLADVTLFGDRVAYSGSGTIVENYGFEDLNTSATGFVFPGDPWTTHGVTYTTGHNMIVGPSAGLGETSNVFTNNSGGSISGAFGSQQYNLFGFNLGNIFGNDTATVVLTTNLGSYSFLGLAAPYILTQPAMSFVGFKAAAGEYFTAFSIAPQSSFAAMDNVTLGFASAVPEPSSCALFLVGLGILGIGARLRRQS